MWARSEEFISEKKYVFFPGFQIYTIILIYDYRYVLGASNLTEFLTLPETEVRILGTKTSQEKIQKNSNKFGLILPNKRTLDYFKSLNKSIILDLLNLFKPDFELFQYDIGSIFWTDSTFSVLNFFGTFILPIFNELDFFFCLFTFRDGFSLRCTF